MSRKIKVAILDTGIDSNHEYLKDNIHEGFGFICTDDYIAINSNYEDDNGHGTTCASIIKNEFNNVEFTVIKVLDKDGRANIQILEEALKMLVDKDIDIINLSLSVMKSEMVVDLYDICEELKNKGKIVVCSLANGFDESYPAVFDNVIGVKGFILEDENSFWFNKIKIQCIIDSNPYFNCNINNTYKLFGKCNSQAAAKLTGKIANILSQSNNTDLNDLYDKLEKLAQRTIWEGDDLATSKRYPDFKISLYERNNPILINTLNIIKEVLHIEKDNDYLYSCSLFNKYVGLNYNKCFELLKKLENKFNIKFRYMEISRDDLLSIYTVTELVEKNLKEKELYNEYFRNYKSYKNLWTRGSKGACT